MKHYLFFARFFFLAYLLSSCSNAVEKGETESEDSSYVVSTSSYISPKMRIILNKIDTCTSAIPIEELIPYDSSTLDSTSTKSSLLRSDDGTTVTSGYSSYSYLYTKVQTTVSDVAASNFYITAGTYYVTCVAATKNLIKEGKIDNIAPYSTDVMGINPKTLTTRGYADTVTITGTGKYSYVLTTYVWGLANGDTSDYVITEWMPRYVSSGGIVTIEYGPQVYLNQLQWRYVY